MRSSVESPLKVSIRRTSVSVRVCLLGVDKLGARLHKNTSSTVYQGFPRLSMGLWGAGNMTVSMIDPGIVKAMSLCNLI